MNADEYELIKAESELNAYLDAKVCDATGMARKYKPSAEEAYFDLVKSSESPRELVELRERAAFVAREEIRRLQKLLQLLA